MPHIMSQRLPRPEPVARGRRSIRQRGVNDPKARELERDLGKVSLTERARRAKSRKVDERGNRKGASCCGVGFR